MLRSVNKLPLAYERLSPINYSIIVFNLQSDILSQPVRERRSTPTFHKETDPFSYSIGVGLPLKLVSLVRRKPGLRISIQKIHIGLALAISTNIASQTFYLKWAQFEPSVLNAYLFAMRNKSLRVFFSSSSLIHI